jgi:parallel beta-helix repeat protein
MEERNMKRAHAIAVVVAVILMIAGIAGILWWRAQTTSKALPLHAPIHINGNAEFARRAQQEGWPGNGTQGNPYVIEGYEIDGKGGTYCIWIESTSVWFVVRKCKMWNAADNTTEPYGTGIYLKNVQYGTIESNICSDNVGCGIFLGSSSYDTIAYNYCSGNSHGGIFLDCSNNSIIMGNNCTTNSEIGIYLGSSSNNTITNNNCSSNSLCEIFLFALCNNNTITSNYCFHNSAQGCIALSFSNDHNTITNNNCSGNALFGIIVTGSTNTTIRNNQLWDNGIIIVSESLEGWNTQVIENNTANGKPVYYYKNQIGGIVQGDAGQIILANCTNIIISGLNLTNVSVGLQLAFSSYIAIMNNTCSGNSWVGISLSHSANNNITNNNCSGNSYYGLHIDSYSTNNIITYNNFYYNTKYGVYITYGSTGNIIHHNNFWQNNGAGKGLTENKSQAYDEVYRNYWYDSTTQQGNYWDNWNGNGWGTPDAYPIDGGAGAYDMYPLSQPWSAHAQLKSTNGTLIVTGCLAGNLAKWHNHLGSNSLNSGKTPAVNILSLVYKEKIILPQCQTCSQSQRVLWHQSTP